MQAYNEEENIEQVIKSWYPLIEEEDRADTSRLVVADSGSSDRTHEILMELQKTIRSFRYWWIPKNSMDQKCWHFTNMLLLREQIIYFKQILMDKQIRWNLRISGK